MTKEITELLEYLKDRDDVKDFKEWATAVEKLEHELGIQIGKSILAETKVEAYERILDKGITVNVYKDGKIFTNKDFDSGKYDLYPRDESEDTKAYQKDLINNAPTIDFESEDKIH